MNHFPQCAHFTDSLYYSGAVEIVVVVLLLKSGLLLFDEVLFCENIITFTIKSTHLFMSRELTINGFSHANTLTGMLTPTEIQHKI